METKNASKDKPKVYLASPVFIEIAKNRKVSSEKKKQILELWDQLNRIAEVKVSDKRFPSEDEIRGAMIDWRANFVGCHLSHPITKEMQTNPDLYAVCTSTAGYNHIQLTDNVLYTNTPGVLHRTGRRFYFVNYFSKPKEIRLIFIISFGKKVESPDRNGDISMRIFR